MSVYLRYRIKRFLPLLGYRVEDIYYSLDLTILGLHMSTVCWLCGPRPPCHFSYGLVGVVPYSIPSRKEREICPRQVQAKSLPDCIKERLLSSFYRTGNSDPHSIGLRSLDWSGLTISLLPLRSSVFEPCFLSRIWLPIEVSL